MLRTRCTRGRTGALLSPLLIQVRAGGMEGPLSSKGESSLDFTIALLTCPSLTCKMCRFFLAKPSNRERKTLTTSKTSQHIIWRKTDFHHSLTALMQTSNPSSSKVVRTVLSRRFQHFLWAERFMSPWGHRRWQHGAQLSRGVCVTWDDN